MKEVPLTQGKVALVDDGDYDDVSAYKWYAWSDKKRKGDLRWYAMRMYRTQDGRRKSIAMHVQLMGTVVGKEVDHRNGDGLDNQRGNLRHATHKQNSHNQTHLQPNKSSRYLGVTFSKRVKLWVAQIKVNDKNIGLGYFKSEEKAAIARREAAQKYFGEFAPTVGGVVPKEEGGW